MLSFAKFCVSSESNGVARNRESPRLLSVPKKGPTAKTARVLRARRRATALVSSLEAPRWHRRRARQWRQVRPPEAGQHKAAGRGQGSQAKRHRHARDRPSAEPGCFDDLPLAGGAKGAGGCLITLEPKQLATGRKKLERTPPRELFHSAVRKTSNKRPTYRGQTRCRMGQPGARKRLMHRSQKGVEDGRANLLDQPIGAGEQGRWEDETKRLSSLEVDHQLELRWLLDWEFGGLCSFGDPVQIMGRAEITVA